MLWLFQSLHVYNSKATRVHLRKLDLPNWQSMSSTVNTIKKRNTKIDCCFLSRILLLLCFLHCSGILDLPWDLLYIVLVVLSSFLFFSQVNMSYFLLIEWQVLYTRRLTQKAKKYHHSFLQLAICGSLEMQVDFKTIVCLSLKIIILFVGLGGDPFN